MSFWWRHGAAKYGIYINVQTDRFTSRVLDGLPAQSAHLWLVHTSQHLPQSQWLGLDSWPILSDCFSNHGTWKGGQLIAGQPLDCGKRFYHLHSLSHLSNVLALSRMRKLWHGGTGLPSAPFSGQASRPPRFLKYGNHCLGTSSFVRQPTC